MVKDALMTDSGMGKRAGKCRGRGWFAGVFGARPPRRREGEGRKLAVETLEERATVSDVLLSLLWSSAPAVLLADTVAEAPQGEGTAIARRSAGIGRGPLDDESAMSEGGAGGRDAAAPGVRGGRPVTPSAGTARGAGGLVCPHDIESDQADHVISSFSSRRDRSGSRRRPG